MQVSFRTQNSKYISGLALMSCARLLAKAAGTIELRGVD